jgi:hypothetical protein
MSDTLTLTGQLTITPDSTSDDELAGDPGIRVPLSDTITLSRKETQTVVSFTRCSSRSRARPSSRSRMARPRA